METDQASQENSDKVTPYDDEPVGGKSGQIRSYECTFCKRGFSNAQALGGHMNIHRKQKSKLRLIPSNNETTHHHHQHQVLDVSTRIAPNYYSFLPKLEAAASRSTTIGIRSSIKWPQESDHQYSTNFWESPHVRAIQELPLFVDKPSSHHDHQQNGISTTRKGGLLSSRHGLPSLELDLELRLGSTDHQDSPATAGTKRFF